MAGLVQAAEAGKVVHISRHGHPVAVLLSELAYAALQGQQQGQRVWRAIAHWRGAARARHADDWPLGSDASGQQDIDAWRDRSPGREVPLE
ncbi:type II toxin-antitoxin system prevent-host-death family antitoxin [Microcystis elabens FACHB-917]|nr:type II toxin-antitoxin system prevent-host-death family antitoxin [Microcystis elabens FACHB-917]